MYLSPHYLGNLFRIYMKQTIKQYHMQLKMEKAMSLIRSSALSITEISDQLGFITPQYFSKSFKDYFGYAPSKLKNR
jgi:Transcriptional regulator containing an amidase domain and an AraC-type DNA-binding HTH domain